MSQVCALFGSLAAASGLPPILEESVYAQRKNLNPRAAEFVPDAKQCEIFLAPKLRERRLEDYIYTWLSFDGGKTVDVFRVLKVQSDFGEPDGFEQVPLRPSSDPDKVAIWTRKALPALPAGIREGIRKQREELGAPVMYADGNFAPVRAEIATSEGMALSEAAPLL